jgi:putative membrane protein
MSRPTVDAAGGPSASNSIFRSARYPLWLAGAFVVIAALLAVGPVDRGTWVLENALAVGLVVVLWLSRNVFPFSNVSYTLVFVFLVLHEVGAHYTYSLVPYDAWSDSLFGRTINGFFGFERNHYDRLVHFMYGFLLAYPMREVFVRVAGAKGLWGYLLPLLMTMASSCLYEIVEWWCALIFGSDVGNAYLGTQGDEFDSQKDMALATLGAILSLSIVFAVHRRLARDFHAEWVESLRIKRKQPLGEHAVAEHKQGP